MAPGQTDQLLAAAAVVAVAVAVMLYNRMAAARPTVAATPASPAPGAAPLGANAWVGRHVQHDGDIVGQVVAVEAATLVVRKGTRHYALPRTLVREQGLDLGTTGPVDLAQAERDGAAWSQGRSGTTTQV